MDTRYTLRASDGKEYGPVTLVQIVAWVHEGRVGEFSQLRRSDRQTWAFARDFEELGFLFGGEPAASPISAPEAAPAVPAATAPQRNPVLVSRMKFGASWFYWIAAVSLVSTLIAATGIVVPFVLALGFTRILDVSGAEMGGAGRVGLAILSLIVIASVALAGWLSNQGRLWAFATGIVLYALDGVLLILAQRWIDVAFHGLALFFLFRGLQACRALRA